MFNFNVYFSLKCLFVLVYTAHILYCPYTKVEESFNIQAIHDIQFYGSDISKYDHHEFPGVVPRTFLGPTIVSFLSYPISQLIFTITENLFFCQLIARFILASLVAFGFFHFTDTVKKLYGANVAKFTVLITMTQFHFCYYMGRTLPNIFALAVFLHAIAFWLKGNYKPFIWLSAASVLIIRSELCLIAGIMLLLILKINFKKFHLFEFIVHSIIAAIVSVGLSVLVDSFFWGYTLWPEGQVLWFNVVLNKSSDYGTSPFLWYFYSAIPRAALFSLLLVPFSFISKFQNTLTNFFIPTVFFVFMYSFLPHKELRFIIYIFPLINAMAAKGLVDLQKYQTKWKTMKKFILFGFYLHFVLNIIATCGFLYISSINYPGAEALNKLHQIEFKDKNINVHLDVLSAQTGITRFLELNRYGKWSYDKSENITVNNWTNFDYLLVEAESDDDRRLDPFKQTHKVVEIIRSYKGIYLNNNKLPIPRIRWTPKIYILKKL